MTPSIRRVLETALLALLILRPSLDAFTRFSIPLGPATLNPAGILSLLLIGLGIVWFLALPAQDRNALLRQRMAAIYGLWILLLLPWAFFSLSVESARLEGPREWIRLASALPLVALAGSLSARDRGRRVVHALLLSFAVPAAAGLYQVLFHQGLLVRGVHRITGTFVHPNPFSFFLGLMIGLTFFQWWKEPRRWGWAGLLLFEMGLLIATYSFTGLVMFAVFTGGVALGMSVRLRWAALAMLLLLAAVFLASPSGRARVREITQIDNLDVVEQTQKETSSFTWRLLNWRYLYRQWKQEPWLGYGLGSSTRINPNFNKYEGTGHHAHNDYVRFGVETGLVGLFFTLAMMAATGGVLWNVYRTRPHPDVRLFALIGLGLYAAWLAGSANDNLSIATAYQYALWSILAAAAAPEAFDETPADNRPSL